MYIVALAWLYVVMMMSVAEHSVTAAILTFLLYGLLPLSIILYLMKAPERRRRRKAEEKAAVEARAETPPNDPAEG